MADVLHVDDLYRENKNDFLTLRNYLSDRSLEVHCVAKFEDAAWDYKSLNCPEVVIVDILDETDLDKVMAV